MKRIAVAGVGAIGSAVCRALIDGIDGFELVGAASLEPAASRDSIARPDFDLPFFPVEELTTHADWIVEALPASSVPALARDVMAMGKTLVMITSAALLLYPDLAGLAESNGGRIIVPSGALAGMDGVNALAATGIRNARLVTTKAPKAYAGAPYILQEQIDLDGIKDPTRIFAGNALQAAAAFPANINVAATLTYASRLAPENVQVEAWADPVLTANRHEVTVDSEFSTLRFTMENKPDPANPKSSALAAMSIIAALRRHGAAFWVG